MKYKPKEQNKKDQGIKSGLNNKNNNTNKNASNKKNTNDVKINNYINDDDITKKAKTNGKLKVEYDDDKSENEENILKNKKKKQDNVLIDYGNIIPDLQQAPTYKNDQYTSSQLESVRYFRDLTTNLEKDVGTLTENERQQSDQEIGDRKSEAKKQREDTHDEIFKEYATKSKEIKKKFKEVNDKNVLFAKNYMEQFMISSAIDNDKDEKLIIKPMVHNIGTMLKMLGEKRDEYQKQAQKNDTYEEVNQNIVNILDRIDEEMGYGSEFSSVRKEMRLFARHINDNTKDTSILSVAEMGFFSYIADKIKRFFSIILSPIWDISYDDGYKLMAKYNKDLLKILESMSSNDFSKVSRPKCIALYRKILELENESLFLPVSKEKYLEPVKKFLRNLVMAKGDVNEDGCNLMIETCGFGNFIASLSKKVAGDNEKVKILMKRYLFENESSIFHNITCTDELLELLKKFDGKDCKKIIDYFYSNCPGTQIKLNNQYIKIPQTGIDSKDEQYKKYSEQFEKILTGAYKGTIVSSSEDAMMTKFKTQMAVQNGITSYKEYTNLRKYIHTMNDVYDDQVDRLNKLDSVYISSIVTRAKKMLEYAKQENISEAKSFGMFKLIRTKIEKMKQDYLDKTKNIENKRKKKLQKNLESFCALRKQLKELISNKKALKGQLDREYYQSQLKKINKYIEKQYGKSANEETEDKERLKEIEKEIEEHIEEKYNQNEQPDTLMYDDAIKELDDMIKEVNTRSKRKPNKILKDIDQMFNERAKNNLEVLKNMKGMMPGGRGGFGGGFGE